MKLEADLLKAIDEVARPDRRARPGQDRRAPPRVPDRSVRPCSASPCTPPAPGKTGSPVSRSRARSGTGRGRRRRATTAGREVADSEHEVEEEAVDRGSNSSAKSRSMPYGANRSNILRPTAGCSHGWSALPPSRPGQRHQVEHARGELEEARNATPAQNSRCAPTSTPTQERHRQHQGEEHVRGRPGQADQAVREPAPDRVPVDPDRAAGQADAAEQQEHHRQHDGQQRVGVLQRVERQVAALGHSRSPPGRRPARGRTRAGTATRSSRTPRTGRRRT